MPFIDMINEKFKVINLNSIDYRLLNTMGMDSYYYPANSPETEDKIESIWKSLTNNARGAFTTVEVAQGRFIDCEKAAKNVGEFTFAELCEDDRGSTDYMAVAQNFQTIILRNVPQLSMDRRDFLRRFIGLIDSLYYNHRNVIIEAAVSLDDLFNIPENEEEIIHDEEFAYTRTLSRLREM